MKVRLCAACGHGRSRHAYGGACSYSDALAECVCLEFQLLTPPLAAEEPRAGRVSAAKKGLGPRTVSHRGASFPSSRAANAAAFHRHDPAEARERLAPECSPIRDLGEVRGVGQ